MSPHVHHCVYSLPPEGAQAFPSYIKAARQEASA
jgi:hypothetical protein